MEKPTSITTIASTSEGLFKEKGSKFLSFAFPVSNESDIGNCLAVLKKEHAKARHHCYAYRLGSGGGEITEFVHDAGEPSGTAGLPIMNALRSAGVSDVLIVVIRYFGGTKLGIPGLINAYKQATQDALQQNQIVIRELISEFKVSLAYEKLDQLYRAVARCNGKVTDQQIDTVSTFKVEIPVRTEKTFILICSDGMEISKI